LFFSSTSNNLNQYLITLSSTFSFLFVLSKLPLLNVIKINSALLELLHGNRRTNMAKMLGEYFTTFRCDIAKTMCMWQIGFARNGLGSENTQVERLSTQLASRGTDPLTRAGVPQLRVHKFTHLFQTQSLTCLSTVQTARPISKHIKHQVQITNIYFPCAYRQFADRKPPRGTDSLN
jgi:hypothetical protein